MDEEENPGWYAGQGEMEQQTLRNTDILMHRTPLTSDVSMHRRHDLMLNPVSKAQSTISTPYPALTPIWHQLQT
ncbi:hypothetical protein VE04_09233 [Pseudogymnoascus sp. 24MN13]|nr:hypothetical protein VE04_09233 [Pseudogymnoascus sp. 24MN13]